MKKLLLFGAMVAMLLGTTGCKESFDEPNSGDIANVNLTIDLGGIESRAIADGLSATKLQIAVYKEDGTLLSDVSKLDANAVTMSGKQATVTFQLVKGVTYKFAFWAQNPNEDAYTFDATNAKIEVDYTKAVANADDGDAFYNYIERTVNGPIDETVVLTRPFAQLNYGDIIADYNAAVAAGLDLSQTVVTVKQVAPTFNLATGSSEGTPVDVVWPAATSVINEDLAVDGTSYKWLSMCYFLVPNDEATIETELSMLNAAGTEFNKLTVDNVPVKKNHRTNILGNLFTETANFKIVIDENFDTPDYNVLLSSAQLAAAVQTPNAVINLAGGQTYDLDLSTVAEGVTINGNGAKLNITGKNNLSAENVTIEGVELINERYTNNKFINVTASNFTMKDVTFSGNGLSFVNGPDYGLWLAGSSEDGNVLIENCTITDESIFRDVMLDCKGTVTIKGCTIGNASRVRYALNTNTTSAKLVVEDTELIGWTSFAGVQAPEFTNCTFSIGYPGYGYLCPYVDTQMTNCIFEWNGDSEDPQQHFLYGPRNACTITFTGCTWSNGNALDSKLLATDNDSQYKDCVAIFGSETWKNISGGNSWTKQE